MARRFAFILFVALVWNTAVLWAQAPPLPAAAVATAAAPEPDVSSVRLLVGRSTVIDVGAPIARVSLTSADIADAMVTSPNQLLVNGKMPGTISMFVWERGGAIRRYELVVQRDLSRLSEQFKQLFPGENIAVQSNGRDIVLSGVVSNKDIIEKAVNLAAGYVDKKEEVTSLLQLTAGGASNQVLLRVRFAEVSRTALTELGASFFTSPTGVKNTLGRVTTQQFSAPGYDELKYSKTGPDPFKFGAPVTSAEGKFTFSDFLNFFLFSEKYDLGTMIRALQTKGLFQSLAEPNLVAESGKEASFLAGGEFPIPIAQPSGGGVTVTVVFKEFGVRLNFTPIVQGNRIHLKVRPEVSTLDFGNAIVLSGFRIPALSTRRTETELELEDGQTFAIAGLLNNSMTKSLQKVPGIGDIPILGLLFRSEAARKDRTELVVMITPQILQRGSRGVTGDLPRQQEPYLPALPTNKSVPAPAAPFQSGASTMAPVTAPTMPVATNPATSPAAAAAAVSALTPGAPKPAAQPAQTTAAPSAAPASQPAATRPLTPEEQKVLERARQYEREKAQSGQAADNRRLERQAEEDRKRLTKEREGALRAKEQQDKLAKEKAKHDVEEAKRQAEIDKKQQKALEEAAARMKAAEAAYQAELAKKQRKDKEK